MVTTSDPARALGPLQAPDAVKVVALTLDHVSVTCPPTSTLEAEDEKVMDATGAGSTTTVVTADAVRLFPDATRL
jgi:hypothetical protein